MWRGFEVKHGSPTKFGMGEIQAEFKNKTLTLTGADGTANTYDVSTVMGDTFSIKSEDGTPQNFVNGLVGNLKYTTAMGLSTFGNATYPDSFGQAMRSNDTSNLLMFQCNRWGGKSTCDFGHDEVMSLFEEFFAPKEEKVGDDPKCARCDKGTETCEECNCETSPECVPAEQCNSSCSPPGPKYKCSWKEKEPKCEEDPDGKSKQLCEYNCKPAVYAKCNYK